MLPFGMKKLRTTRNDAAQHVSEIMLANNGTFPVNSTKLRITSGAENLSKRVFGPVCLRLSTNECIPSNYIFLNVGTAKNDQTLVIREDKVESYWFGKELQIILERVDRVNDEKFRGDRVGQTETIHDKFQESHHKKTLKAFEFQSEQVISRAVKSETNMHVEGIEGVLICKQEIENDFTVAEGMEFDGVEPCSDLLNLDPSDPLAVDSEQAMKRAIKSETDMCVKGIDRMIVCKQEVEDNFIATEERESKGFELCSVPLSTELVLKPDPDMSDSLHEPVSGGSTDLPHIRTHSGEKPFSCSNCNARFAYRSRLNCHAKTHTGEKPFSYSHCSKRFTQSSQLKQHVKMQTGEKPFSCSHCSKRFAFRSKLNIHVRTHTGEKPFRCSHCSKWFVQLSQLKQHVRIHTGEKPFSCSHCSRRFARSSSLKEHLRTHTGDKPFSCSHCSARFALRSCLNRHATQHTGDKRFSCSHCSAKFSTSGYRNIHVRSHTGERPFACSFSSCNAKFSSNSGLMYHMKIHMGEKPFSCSHCKASFTYKNNFKRHLLTVHGS